MDNYTAKFSEYLRKKGLKFTPERRIILKEIFSLHGHFDVDQLYEKLRQKREDISRATIYRTLPLLVECGLVRETFRCQEKVSYEHVFGHKHHDHMVCVKCGRVIEFRDDRIEKLQDDVCNKHGFEPVEYKLGIRGYCKKCRSKKR